MYHRAYDKFLTIWSTDARCSSCIGCFSMFVKCTSMMISDWESNKLLQTSAGRIYIYNIYILHIHYPIFRRRFVGWFAGWCDRSLAYSFVGCPDDSPEFGALLGDCAWCTGWHFVLSHASCEYSSEHEPLRADKKKRRLLYTKWDCTYSNSNISL